MDFRNDIVESITGASFFSKISYGSALKKLVNATVFDLFKISVPPLESSEAAVITSAFLTSAFPLIQQTVDNLPTKKNWGTLVDFDSFDGVPPKLDSFDIHKECLKIIGRIGQEIMTSDSKEIQAIKKAAIKRKISLVSTIKKMQASEYLMFFTRHAFVSFHLYLKNREPLLIAFSQNTGDYLSEAEVTEGRKEEKKDANIPVIRGDSGGFSEEWQYAKKGIKISRGGWFSVLKRKGGELSYTESALKQAGGASAFIGGKRNTPIIGNVTNGGRKDDEEDEESN